MIETQKHQQSFEALGLFQIDFGLMTLIGTKSLDKAKDFPPWVFSPDFERAEWINQIMKSVWPKVEEMLVDQIVS